MDLGLGPPSPPTTALSPVALRLHMGYSPRPAEAQLALLPGTPEEDEFRGSRAGWAGVVCFVSIQGCRLPAALSLDLLEVPVEIQALGRFCRNALNFPFVVIR